MHTFRRRFRVASAALLSLCTFALLPGCEATTDWLTGPETGARTSPYISSLSISPATVGCGVTHPFTVSFRYDDPQGDISQGTALFQLEGATTTTEQALTWPDNVSRGNGTISFSLSFTCTQTEGLYTISVEVEDDRSHKSNTLTGTITLN